MVNSFAKQIMRNPDDTEVLIKEKNLLSKDIYWLEMEQDSYRDDKEKFEAIQKTIDKLKVT
jgi:hypothetical protein